MFNRNLTVQLCPTAGTANTGHATCQRKRATGGASVIGADLSITGNLESTGEVQIDGELQGDVHAAASWSASRPWSRAR